MSSKSVLGRGLGALLKDRNHSEQQQNTITSTFVPISLVDVDKNQPRKFFDEKLLQELAESIKHYGVIQPITVKKKDNGRYHIISGERRFRASQMAGLATIPVFLLSIDDAQILEVALIENLQREDLNAIEIAVTLNDLLEKLGISQEDLGKKLGKDRSTITNYIRLLKLPKEIRNALAENLLTMGHARALVSINLEDDKMKIFKEILKNNLSVREVEQRVKNLLNPKISKQAFGKLKEKSNALTKKLRKSLNMNIKVNAKSDGKGEVKISFNSEDELNKIINFLENQ